MISSWSALVAQYGWALVGCGAVFKIGTKEAQTNCAQIQVQNLETHFEILTLE